MNLRRAFLSTSFVLLVTVVFGQVTNNSGSWNNMAIWTPNTVPTETSGTTTSPVRVLHTVTINQNITIGTGVFHFEANATDDAGTPDRTLTVSKQGGYNSSQCILDVISGTTTFDGSATFDNANVTVRDGATLVIGALLIKNNTRITIESGGTLIINGDVTDNNNGGGAFTVGGYVQINGDYTTDVGGVDLSGSGVFQTTGTITTTGGSTVFGSSNDCTTGPCSGASLGVPGCFTSNIASTSSANACRSNLPLLTATTNASASRTFQWQSSTTSAGLGFNDILTETSSTYSVPSTISQTTWYRVIVTDGTCTSTSVAVQINPLQEDWLGTTSSDWNTASNWCLGTVPTASTNIIIPSLAAVTASSSASVNNLTIESGASLTLSGSAPLQVYGNLNTAGSLSAGTSTVSFVGTAQQTITGTYSLNGITSTNSSGVLNNGNISLSGPLTLSGGGTFDMDGTSGSLTLVSSGLTTGGRIEALTTPGNLSGNLTFQRFVDGPDDWRYLSVPLTSANVGQWQSVFPVTGNFTNASPVNVDGVICSECASIYTWNASTQAYAAVGSGGATGATPLSYLSGYAVYTYLTSDLTISMSGAPVKGGVSIPLATGYNLIPNPYPSPIDWDNVTTTGTTATVYMTTADGAFATYVNGAGSCTGCSFNSNWRGELAMGQAFWIESTGATSISLAETAKTTSATFAREKEEVNNMLRLAVSSDNMKDDMVVRFVNDATIDWDNGLDAKKKDNVGYINLSSYSQDPDLSFAINSVPALEANSEFNLKLKLGNTQPGNYELKFTELDKLSLDYHVVLIDKYLGQELEIVNNDVYKFTVDQNAASSGAQRFEIKFSYFVTSAEENDVRITRLYPNPATTELIIELDEATLPSIRQISLQDISGRSVQVLQRNQIMAENTMDMADLHTGLYILKVSSASGQQVFKILKQ